MANKASERITLRGLASLLAKDNQRMANALRRIYKWQEHEKKLDADYSANGARDYYRMIARRAIPKGKP